MRSEVLDLVLDAGPRAGSRAFSAGACAAATELDAGPRTELNSYTPTEFHAGFAAQVWIDVAKILTANIGNTCENAGCPPIRV